MHGKADVVADGAIVRISGVGPFSVEFVHEYAEKLIGALANTLEGQPVVTIGEVRNSVLATPEAWTQLEALIGQMKSGPYRIVGTSWVMDEHVEGRGLMLPRIRRLYAESGRVFGEFTTVEAAEIWANEILSKD